ncbi:polypeptide N-acetylgalactosaminyltransferase [Mytilus galloprovincialis]|uniref:Polypeptide N-acetylgalactosaminyltransferase n=1 Tax=Mytilus galloprovincialis TaxID=29158 RepID=A0A8B6HH24_MYTGA|nr:polypeptide N-acetylgalactosaminyltransferase [Mytilus galloprovincialis]
MNLVRLLRRKLSAPIFLLLLVAFLWYSIFMVEDMTGPNDVDTESMDVYDVKLRQAINENTPPRDHVKPLEPPDDHDKNPESPNFPIHDKMKEPAVDQQIDNIHEQNVNIDENKQEVNKKDEKLQIKPPLKELPKFDVLVKEGLGENGQPVNISKDSLSEEQKRDYKTGWKNNAFNEYLSNRISLDRTLQDPRDEKCKLIKYPENLPDVSVIVTFHNEAWSVLLRSVHSIVNRTPKHLLREVILADDCSDMPHLAEPLDKYLEDFPKVKVVRALNREGLIRARLRGYRAATGTVLVFLDSHIECAEGWIEPMLDRIAKNWTTVVTPVIDVINDDTFGFQFQDAKATSVGGFDWNMVFTWHGIPEEERKRRNYEDHTPVRSPTMAGGLFAISHAYFTYIGTYDDGMDIWGGENLEISFRIWMCGGTLETTPCSHVGHIFRKRSPYKWRSNINVLLKNNVRLCEVWLDDYKEYYYDRIGHNLGDYGNITSRIELRKKLKCKSFEWFLKNVYPEMWVPGESLAYGQIRAKTRPYCLAGNCDYGQTGKPLSMANCSVTQNLWYMTTAREIRRDYGCFDYSGNPVIQVQACHQMGGNQAWEFREDNTLYHVLTNKCLEISQDGKKLFMNTCLGTDYQIWLWNRTRPKGATRNWNSRD